ncbi:integrator complex subunit 6 isoform X2 [Centrocercus urophasianus]|uniref:integrator complex subunit 6 isoform X2 n=1 Tax=Centrocercus urophasianus TaxID=9002 RepID=UPI001C653C5B|nr:integrator complex subunit 6 isoform X2 [Centrocercus urophasianus]XP_052526790.1 integrator complex subunit 6 isoform X2 [Tympanuchus pallidicinctus]
MPILLFLIDTSASMNQRTHLGTTYLDIAKGAVETFMKLRARDPASRGDRYMLVTFEEPPYAIKAGWKENHATFMNELKNLQAEGLTTLGQSLRTAFDLLNLNRLVTGIDNYGQGRNPFFLEPAIIITVTDGSKLTTTSGIQEELHLPLNSPLPGSELTKEPFRWDQRLFALVLRLPGVSSPESEQMAGVPVDDSAITPMCEVTGGRSYCVCSPRMLNQCLESLVQKVQSGVVINFEKAGPDPSPIDDGQVDITRPFGPQPWHSCHKLIYVRPNPKTGVPIGHWPVPESFWPDQNSPTLPPRTSHPVVKFSCTDCEPMVIDKLPFDKYELEPSPLTQFILERKSPQTCWQVYVSNSAKYSELGHPFGYLKASTALNCVNLFVMPYNYPVLLPLLDDLFKVHKAKPTLKWLQSFESYLKTMPPYYLGPLKKAVRMMGAPNLIADNVEYGLSYSVISYLKKLSQQDLKPQTFRNAYDIPRRNLLDQLTRMRSNLLKSTRKFLKGQDEDQVHSVPIAQMGNYQEYLKQIPSPLRELDPDQPRRLHTFGNPFKLDKKGMMIDEADEFVSGPQNKHKRPGEPSMQGIPKRRRCMSPLLRGRPQTPPVVNNHIGGKGPPSPITQAQLDLVKPIAVHKTSEANNEIAMDDVVENHVTDSLSSDDFPDAVDSEFSMSSPFNSLDRSAAHIEGADHEHIGNNLNVDGFLENHDESSSKEQNTEDSLPLSSTSKGKKTVPCRSSREINMELRAQIMKEIRKPGRKYERIFLLLKHVQGSLQTRLIFLQNVIKEASRFKKRMLIEQLESFLEEIHRRSNQVNHINSS